MRVIFFVTLILASFIAKSQTSYSGLLGKYPITLIIKYRIDSDCKAYYVYNKHDTPITINGNSKGNKLKLLEYNRKGEISAYLIFPNFKQESDIINGKWISKDSSRVYDISLTKDFEISSGENEEWNYELLEAESTKKHYFRTIITKEKGEYYSTVSGVKIFEKKTDRLVQTIELECQFIGLNSLSIGDYNFDGINDFSVFESSYSGSNTTSIYMLKNPNTGKYFKSTYSGISLEFDNKAKLIYEKNSCCAGISVMNATYKVVNNKMVLIKKKCLKYNEEEKDFVEVECD